jgi:hypothetical protein
MLDWGRAKDLVGETVREMGLLILVFAPLDAVFADAPVNRLLLIMTIVFGLLFVAGGIPIEARKLTS